MGKLLCFPNQSLPLHFSIPEFEPSSDEVGAMLISGDKPNILLIIYSPLERTRQIEWSLELEAKWILTVREKMRNFCSDMFEDIDSNEEFIASLQAIILLWDPILKVNSKIERIIMGGIIEIIWPGILTDRLESFLKSWLDIKYGDREE